jgi:hypothetical protein
VVPHVGEHVARNRPRCVDCRTRVRGAVLTGSPVPAAAAGSSRALAWPHPTVRAGGAARVQPPGEGPHAAERRGRCANDLQPPNRCGARERPPGTAGCCAFAASAVRRPRSVRVAPAFPVTFGSQQTRMETRRRSYLQGTGRSRPKPRAPRSSEISPRPCT